MSDFWNGFLHVLIAPEQCIALLALGFIMARLETDQIDAPFHFHLIGFSVGLVIGIVAVPPESELMRPVPLVLAGLLLVNPAEAVKRIPRSAVAAAAVVAGLTFGSSVPVEVSRLVFAAGMFLGAILLPTYVMVLWGRFYRPWMRIAIRIVGSWMAAIGIILFGAVFR